MKFTRCCTWPHPHPHYGSQEPSGAWDVNDRLRADATRFLVDGALSAKTELIVVPTAAFVYPPGPADESTPLAPPEFLRAALKAEAQLRRFTDAGRRGVALRLGSLYGPEAASAMPTDRYNVRLHTHDAGRALVAALSCPGGIYSVCDDTNPVSHDASPKRLVGDPGRLNSPQWRSADLLGRLLLQAQAAALPARKRG
jgi:nucleoside-diphosphate-sugar epimerase